MLHRKSKPKGYKSWIFDSHVQDEREHKNVQMDIKKNFIHKNNVILNNLLVKC